MRRTGDMAAARPPAAAPRIPHRRGLQPDRGRWHLRIPAAVALAALVVVWTGGAGHALKDQAGGDTACPVCHLVRHVPVLVPDAAAPCTPAPVVHLLGHEQLRKAPRRPPDGPPRPRAPPAR